MDKSITVSVIKKDTLVPIEVSGAFLMRVKNSMMLILDRVEDIKATVSKIEKGEKLDPDEHVIQTFLMLIKEVEDVAEKNKLTVEEKLIINQDPSES